MKRGIFCVLLCMLMVSCIVVPTSSKTISQTMSQPLSVGSILYVGGIGPYNYTKPSSNQGCDCEKTAGVASWPFPLICGIVGALVVIFTLIVANTDIGNYMLVMLLYLYTVFNCG